MKKSILSIFLISLTCLLVWQCGNKNNPDPQKPTISGISPLTGSVGTPVTITGTNFSATLANNVVKFNGTDATITAVTTTSLSVTVPQGATTGKITVIVAGQTATSNDDFTITSSASDPTIASFTPTSGGVNTTVTITGTNFSATASANIVKFNGVTATVTTATETSITTTVPTNANTGKITVEVAGKTATSTNDFTVTSLAKDVYISGNYFNGTKGVAGYWKNGVANELPNGSTTTGIVVSGSDVHVVGYEYVPTQNRDFAKYWKNGVVTALPSNSNGSRAVSMFISGSDVYVAGYEKIINNTAAVYWKNGVKTTLSVNGSNAEATAIYVSGTDVHVVGKENNVGKYWKNGTAIAVGGINAQYTSIYVSGNDVYIGGYEYNGTYSVAKYWKNGVATSLTAGTVGHGYVTAITVVGNDVHTVGYEFNGSKDVAKYWKNTVLTNLSDGTKNSYARALAVDGADIYVTGYDVSLTNGSQIARYWKNGVLSNLDSTTSGSSIGNSIFVK
ncbi:MAG: IPT/TIG domain-containing protein [Raineya sp.]|jgi:hypothetical protein|nr:IPT/TIG domain-containing protein [Raineya sp.]